MDGITAAMQERLRINNLVTSPYRMMFAVNLLSALYLCFCEYVIVGSCVFAGAHQILGEFNSVYNKIQTWPLSTIKSNLLNSLAYNAEVRIRVYHVTGTTKAKLALEMKSNGMADI